MDVHVLVAVFILPVFTLTLLHIFLIWVLKCWYRHSSTPGLGSYASISKTARVMFYAHTGSSVLWLLRVGSLAADCPALHRAGWRLQATEGMPCWSPCHRSGLRSVLAGIPVAEVGLSDP